jgi:outer membrane protein assembly factor BamB
VVLFLAGTARGWVSTQHAREGAAGSVALFANGDVATSVGYGDVSPSDAGVLRLDATTGTLVWRSDVATTGRDDLLGVAVGPDDNVITVNDSTRAVIKLDGATGAVLWQTTLVVGNVYAFTVDANGDVVLGGSVLVGPRDREVVTKYSGTSGAVLWTLLLSGSYVRALTTDATGDIFVATIDATRTDGSQNAILRSLSGVDGHSNWDVALPIPTEILEHPTALTLDRQGRLVALLTDTVRPSNDEGAKPVPEGSWWVAVSTEAASGRTLWRTEVHAPTKNAHGLPASSITTAPDGTVYAGGALGTPTNVSIYGFAVVALDGATGSERWRHVLNRAIGFLSVANAVAVAPDGSVVAVGRVDTKKADAPAGFITSLRPSDGRALSEENLPIQASEVPGSSLAIDAGGGLVVPGFVYEPFVGTFPSVVKLRSNGTDFGGPTLGMTPRPVVRTIND